MFFFITPLGFQGGFFVYRSFLFLYFNVIMYLMDWALRRQIMFLVVFISILTLLGVFLVYPYFQKAPSCVDNIQNGTETGVDCGGSCTKACNKDVDAVSIIWARAFKVVDGRYNAVAYLENHNKDIAVNKINYRFRFADKDNVYIGKREGTTTIPPSGKFAVFEPAIDVGNSIPIYTTFQFTEVPNWTYVSSEKTKQLNITISNIALANTDTNPILSATIKNNSILNIPNLNVVAILYDDKNNAIASSNTYLENLNRQETKDINFTWPLPILSKVVFKELIPVYNIFNVNVN